MTPTAFNVGFTGTRRGMSRSQVSQLRTMLTALPVKAFHYGTHKTVSLFADAEAAQVAKAAGIPLIPYEAERGTEVRRDERLVDAVDVLIATPDTDVERLRSGTWTTVRRARTKGIPVIMLSRGGM